MKKIFLFLIIFNIMAFADNNYKIYEKYVNEMLHYSLPFNYSFFNPFTTNKSMNDKKVTHKKVSFKNNIIIKKKVEVTLKVLARLNNKILISFNNGYKNEQKWLQIGESIEGYKLMKIMESSVLFRYKNKEKIVSIKNKINKLKIKVSK
jgi:hypothetical protein